jgi:two-component system phosphate regulon sensor histidine kinase PhoR
MKPNRTHLFVAISSLALLVVLIIQVNWIFQTAKIKEALFNEKANLVLSKTVEALSSDSTLHRDPGIYLDATEVNKIDSLLNVNMKFYHIHLEYSFQVIPLPGSTRKETHFFNPGYQEQSGIYQTCIEEVPSGKNSMELKLVFPKKEQFILAEMGIPFISSVVLILVVLIMSWRTILSLVKEKKISEHTTEFLNNMTHEFKTPLTNIGLAGKMLMKDPAVEQGNKIKHYSEIILEENEKLKLQVEQMLSMTALERGEIPLRKSEVDLHVLIHEAVKRIRIQIDNKEGNLHVYPEAEQFVIMGDQVHLTNALANLIDNSIKYSIGKPEIKICTSNARKHFVFTISDQGIGIEKEFQKKVFDQFFRVPTGDVHDVKGSGLGLAYVKKIVELHGGTVSLWSEKGKGTTFTLTLPYA